MASSFQDKIDLIRKYEPVTAAGVNRPLRQLAGNVAYLRDLINSASIGAAVFARQQPASSDVQEGWAVYYNASTKRFEPAIAEVDTSPSSFLTFSPSSQVWGVVSKKLSLNLVDVLMLGFAEVDISTAVSGEVTAGLYYLSSTSPGRLTKSRPSIPIPVLRATGDGHVFVAPNWRDIFTDHLHYKFMLQPQPAGDHEEPEDEGRHVITNPDTSIEGWLPADHASFGGNAPEGAVFGYNIAANSELKALWPPHPLSSAHLAWDKGDSYLGITGVPLGERQLCVIDEKGIWWMSDCYGDVPWPATTPGGSHDDYYESIDSLPSGNECPRYEGMNLILYFTKPAWGVDTSVVTSLVAAEGSPLSITCALNGEPASSGPLEIDVDLELTSDVDDEPGYLVFKSTDGSSLNAGPVCEGLYTEDARITISGDTQRTFDTDKTLHMGKVELTLSLDSDVREVDPTIVKLVGVTEEYPNNVPALSFPAGQTTALLAKINIPTKGLPSSAAVRIRLQVGGSDAGTLPALNFGYRVLPQAPTVSQVVGGSSPEAIPSSETSGTLTISGVTVGALEYVTATTNAINVENGDTLVFSIGRLSTDNYGGEVYILRMEAALEPRE